MKRVFILQTEFRNIECDNLKFYKDKVPNPNDIVCLYYLERNGKKINFISPEKLEDLPIKVEVSDRIAFTRHAIKRLNYRFPDMDLKACASLLMDAIHHNNYTVNSSGQMVYDYMHKGFVVEKRDDKFVLVTVYHKI